MDSTGKSLVYASLWELLTGGTPVLNSTAVSGGVNTNVYFTAGLAGETHGLLGAIANTTVSGATPTFGFSAATGAITVTNGSSGAAMLSVAPVNGFSGNVTFYCTGLPSGATCSFSPASVNVASNAVSTTQVTIDTSGMAQKMGRLDEMPLHLHPAFVLTLASLLPFSLLLLRRRLTFREKISLIVPLLRTQPRCGRLYGGLQQQQHTAPRPHTDRTLSGFRRCDGREQRRPAVHHHRPHRAVKGGRTATPPNASPPAHPTPHARRSLSPKLLVDKILSPRLIS